MSRCTYVLLISLAFAAVTANATSPPAKGGYMAGWGMNPTDWQDQSGSFSSWGLYDPNHTGGGASWVVGWDPISYISYAPVTLELWIEMNLMVTYHYTSYQWHRLGNAAETITFTIDGTNQSNDTQVVLMSPSPGYNLSYLQFEHNIFGGSSTTRTQIPINWEVRWGNGLQIGQSIMQPWTAPYWLCGNMLLNNSGIPPCDHWFQFKGTFSLNYHEADGYYKLGIAGCPYPVI